jgi:hypothetical protein
MPAKVIFAWYPRIMAGGMVLNVNVNAAAGGFLRNFVVFPHARRPAPPHDAPQRF